MNDTHDPKEGRINANPQAQAQAAQFLRRNRDRILSLWQAEARAGIGAAATLNKPLLLDSLPDFVDHLILSLEGMGDRDDHRESESELGRIHGTDRSQTPSYDLSQIVDEYFLLQRILFRVLNETGPINGAVQARILEGIQTAVRESLNAFLRKRQESEKALSHELSRSTGSLQLIVESIHDHAIIQTDPQGRVVKWNSGAENLFGWKRDEVNGKNAALIFTPEDLAAGIERREMRKAFESGKAEDDRWHLRKDGSRIYVSGILNPLRDERGDLLGFVKVVRDLTQAKLLEEERDIFFRLPEVLIGLAENDGKLKRVNPAWTSLLGFEIEELVDRPLHGFIHPDDVALATEQLNLLRKAADSIHVECRWRRKQGGFTWIRWVCRRIDHKIYLVGYDISDVKAAEQALRDSKLNAERASELKSEFLANMSHEIRTPMTSILGFTELLREPQLNEHERQDAISRIESSGRALLRLIDDVLDISKIEAGRLELQRTRFSPLEIASEVIALMRISADRKGIGLRLQVDPTTPSLATSDVSRIRQILVNLVGNAVKFTTKGEVVVTVHATKDERLVFEVSDTGIGIAEQDQKKLFQQFAQADGSITRKFGGTGLGLVLSRRIAERLGGVLNLVKSAPGKGSLFVADLPCGPFEFNEIPSHKVPQPAPLSNEALAPSALAGFRILLAEDVPDNQVLMRRFLEGAGASVKIVSDGQQAIEAALHGRFNIVLMDIQMPVLDGIQATKKLRAQGFSPPIVALTAHAMPEEISRSLSAGCSAHLTKPITKPELIKAVQAYARNPLDGNAPGEFESR